MEKKWIKIRSIIEILGSPKEHVERTMGIVLGKLKEKKDLKVLGEKTFEAEKIKDKPFWSVFTELDIEARSIDALLGYCFDFMPSSIEILEPERLDFQCSELNNVLNDVLGRLHQYDMILKNLYAENILLKKRFEGKLKESEKDRDKK